MNITTVDIVVVDIQP